jgi:hypothetical protein
MRHILSLFPVADLGYAFSPLHKNVPKAALADPRLYELLALVDAPWDGKSRERELAARELSERLEASPDDRPEDA